MTYRTHDQLVVQNRVRLLWEWGNAEAVSGVWGAWQRRLRDFAGGDDEPPYGQAVVEALAAIRGESAEAVAACEADGRFWASGDELPADDRAAAGLLAEQMGEAIEARHGEQCERAARLAEAAAAIWGGLASVDPAMAAGPESDLESWHPSMLPPVWNDARLYADRTLGWPDPIWFWDCETAIRRLGSTVAERLQNDIAQMSRVWWRFEAERVANKARAIAAGARAGGSGGDGAACCDGAAAAAGDDMVLAELPPDAILILRVLAGGTRSRAEITESARTIEGGRVIGKNRVGELVRNELLPRGLVSEPGPKAVRLTDAGADLLERWRLKFERDSGRAVRRTGA